MNNKETIVILDFYSQFNQLIARRVRECNVYSEVLPYDVSVERIKKINPKGIIFTGGPASVYEADSPRCDKEIFNLGIPILRNLLWYAIYELFFRRKSRKRN